MNSTSRFFFRLPRSACGSPIRKILSRIDKRYEVKHETVMAKTQFHERPSCGHVDPVPAAVTEEWPRYCIELRRPSRRHVLLHRAAKSVGCFSECSEERFRSDFGALDDPVLLPLAPGNPSRLVDATHLCYCAVLILHRFRLMLICEGIPQERNRSCTRARNSPRRPANLGHSIDEHAVHYSLGVP